jgi:hypothetical protein
VRTRPQIHPPVRTRARRCLLLCVLLAFGVLGASGTAGASTTHDLRGSWSCCGSGGAGAQTFNITTMDLSSGSFSGTANYPSGSAFSPITGTASGDSVSLTTGPYYGSSYSATFTGTISADNNRMSGTWMSNSSQSGTWTATRTSGPPSGGGGGGGGGNGGAAKRPTATRVICNYFVATASDTCIATVGDAGAPPRTTPTGAVKFASANGGIFTAGNSCELTPTPYSPGVASCSVEFLPPSSTFPQVAAGYLGDAEHDGSFGATTFYILGGVAGGLGVDLGAQPALGSRTTSPVTVGCPSQGTSSRTSLAHGAAVVDGPTIEDRITDVLTQCLIKMDADIKMLDNPTLAKPCGALHTVGDVSRCSPPIRDAFNAQTQIPVDVETQKLKQMVAKRNEMFEQLRKIIDGYYKTSTQVINQIGRSVPAAQSARTAKGLVLGRGVRVVVRVGHSRAFRITFTRAGQKLLGFPRKLRKLLPKIVLPIEVRIRIAAVTPLKGSTRKHVKLKRTTITRVVAFSLSP